MNIRDLSAGSSLLGQVKMAKKSNEKTCFERQYLVQKGCGNYATDTEAAGNIVNT